MYPISALDISALVDVHYKCTLTYKGDITIEHDDDVYVSVEMNVDCLTFMVGEGTSHFAKATVV